MSYEESMAAMKNANTKKFQREKIAIMVEDRAFDIFRQCDAESDYCIQSVGGVAVFGSTNRLCWSPITGFYVVRSMCTSRFLKLYDKS